MGPALERFFNISEVVSILASYLKEKDVSSLMQTCHFIHEAMKPSFYHDLVLQYDILCKTFWESPERLRALANNIQYVRTLNCNYIFVIYYYRALLAQSRHNGGNTVFMTTPSELCLKESHFPDGIPSIELVPLPPMGGLVKAELSLDVMSEDEDCLFQPYDENVFYASIFCFDRVMRDQLSLRILEIHDIVVKDIRQGQILSSTLLSLSNLEDLRIGLLFPKNCNDIILPLCFSLPPSVKDLSIIVNCEIGLEAAVYSEVDNIRLDHKFDFEGLDQGTWRWKRRNTPLKNLKYFHMSDRRRDIATVDYLPFFRDCPNLEGLHLSDRCNFALTSGTEIGIVCPKLIDISYWSDEREHHCGFRQVDIAETLPENQLRTIVDLERYDTYPNDNLMRRTLLRHSESLCWIRFSSLSSRDQQILLQECRSLEYYNVGQGYIDLSDAVMAPWGSSSLRHLVLNIRIVLPSSPQRDYIACYLQTPAVSPSDEERRIFSLLGILYRQIGKQFNLEHLNIGRVSVIGNPATESSGKVMCMPGMLRLDEGDPGRPGYLDLFGDLSKLSYFAGAIHPETPNDKILKNSKEYSWLNAHWPNFGICSHIDGFFLMHKGT